MVSSKVDGKRFSFNLTKTAFNRSNSTAYKAYQLVFGKRFSFNLTKTAYNRSNSTAYKAYQ